MFKSTQLKLWRKITDWLTYEPAEPSVHPSDFARMRHEIRPADVLLVEGRSRVSEIIKIITLSSWSHAALYIGRVHDIEDPDLREYLQYHYQGDLSEPLVIEALLGEGTIVAPLSKYKDFHLRICRPKGLSHVDAEKVVRYGIGCLTLDYNVRQFLDLARFLFPYGILPRRWRSSLFEHNTGVPTQTVCSTMIAEAFREVNFPILPLLVSGKEEKMKLKECNEKLITPRHFDYSPYFEIVKYPRLGFDELAIYRRLPWDEEDVHDHDIRDNTIHSAPGPETETPRDQEAPSLRSINTLLKSVFSKSTV